MPLAEIAATCGALLTIAALVRFVGRPLWRLFRKAEAFFEDWFGQPARPGQKAVPGIPTRVAALEDDMAAVKEQVTPNGGMTQALGDRVVRIEKRLGTDPDEQ